MIPAHSGTNLSLFSAYRGIDAYSGDKSVAIRRATMDCCKLSGPICPNSARNAGLLHIVGTNLSQFSPLR